MVLKLLAVGDIHLGREPSKTPTYLDKDPFQPAAVLARVVDFALENEVTAVLLAGDVVDDELSVFQALSCLRGLEEKLSAHGIGFCAVAGNHDARVLPRLVKQLNASDFLIGAGGKWEHKEFRQGKDAVAVWGWSFPDKHFEYSPLVDASIERIPDMPNIGILHCDLDQYPSHYAPVKTTELRSWQLDGWVLGHVHRPDKLDTELCGYLGSLTPLSPKETGAHGPWLLCIEDGRIQVSHLPMAALRWERWTIDITTCANKEAIADEYMGQIIQYDKCLSKDAWCRPDAVCLQLTLDGIGRHGKDYVDQFEQDPDARVSPVHIGSYGVAYFTDRVENAALPDVDLKTLAAGDDLPGLLAKKLLMLSDFLAKGCPLKEECKDLLKRGAERIRKQKKRTIWKAVDSKLEEDKNVAKQTHRACLELLHAMLAQNPGKDGQ